MAVCFMVEFNSNKESLAPSVFNEMPQPDGVIAPIDRTARRRRFTVSLLVAFFLAGGLFSFSILMSDVAQELSFLALTIPVFLQIKWGLVDSASMRSGFSSSFPYLLPLILSFAFNFTDLNANILHTTVVLLNVVYAFFLGSVLGSCRNGELYPQIMRHLMIIVLPVFVYVIYAQRGAMVWGRWEPYGFQPNWWGMMALGLAWCALAHGKALFRYAGLGIALYYMFKVQSRGAMVAFIPAFLFCSGYFLPLTAKRVAQLGGICLVGLIFLVANAMLSSHGIGERVMMFLSDDVMRINDPLRGAGSGMTGRAVAYAVAWEAFLDSPILGGGYGEFEFVHNGFLLTLAESGVFALIGILFLLGKSMSAYLKGKDWEGFGYVASYIVTLLTFPRSFNINMTSLLVIIVLMNGVCQSSLSRKNKIRTLM
jgi:hypothetical protein